MKKARKERKVWKVIKERKKRKGVNEGIEMETWKQYFMRLLGEVEDRMLMEGEGERRRRGAEADIGKGEFREAFKRMRDEKAE